MPSPTEVLATIPVGMQPRWVAIAPGGGRAYVTLEDFHADGVQGAVAVIDIRTNTVTATIPVGHPSGVVVAPDGRHAYVPNWDAAHGRGVVSVIDTATTTLVDSVTVSGQGGGPNGVAITPDGRHVYVATDHEVAAPEGQGKVTVIDTSTSTVATTIRGNPFPSAVAITPGGDFAHVLDHDGNPQVIDTRTHQSSFPLAGVISGSGRIAFTPDGRHAYVVGDADVFVEVIEVASSRLVTIVDVFGGLTTDVAVAPDGRHAYVTERPGESSALRPVRVIDTATHKVTDSPVTWSGSADGLAITPDGLTAYVSDRRSRAVRVVPLQPPATT